MILLKLTAKHEDRKIMYYDTTGEYDAEENPGGWGGSNPLRTDANSATLYISYQGNEYQTIDVTEAIENGSGDSVLIETINGQDSDNDLKDGVYTAYLLVKFPTDYIVSPKINTCLINNVIYWSNQFWATLAAMYDVYKFKMLSKECTWLNAHIAGLEALDANNQVQEFVNLLKIVQERIEVNKGYFLI